MMMIRILTKDVTAPASTISTQLLLTNLLLAIADLPGEVGSLALALALASMPGLVGLLRMLILPRLLAKAGHAANDLCVISKPPPSCLGKIQWNLTNILTMFFSFCCSFIQCFQLQASKVSDDSNITDMHFCQHLVCSW